MMTSKGRVHLRHFLPPLLAAWLSACGSGGDGAGPVTNPTPASVSGWVGERDAWPQARVNFSCADGSTTQVTTGADGRYSAALAASALPCLIQARTPGGAVLWSAATAAGQANVTPLSTAVLSRALRTTPATLYGSPALARRATPAALAQAQADLDTAVADLGLGQPGPGITTPIGANAGEDPLVRAQGRWLDQLAARGMTPATFNHALAHDRPPAELAQALAQANLGRLLALPSAGAEGVMPQLVRRNVSGLAGSSSHALLLAHDLVFRSDDEGRSWQAIDLILDAVVPYKGALVGVGPTGVMRSTDGGLTWQSLGTPVLTPTLQGYYLGIGPDLRLWWFSGDPALVSDDGIRWQAATSDPGVQNAVLYQMYRTPPLRSLIQESGKPLRACLAAQCVDVGAPSLRAFWRVHGSDEVVAWMPEGKADISTDGLHWQAFGTDPTWSSGLLRTAPGRLLGLDANILSASDDNGQTWQRLATAPSEEWQPTGSNRRRGTGSNLELSTDGGQHWHAVPSSATEPGAGPRAPDGSRLRIRIAEPNFQGSLEFSADAGQTWSTTSLADPVRSVAWLGDRWGAITVAGQLHTSRDGRQWEAAGPVPSVSTESSFTGADGVWVVGSGYLRFGIPDRLHESTDGGRTWTEVMPLTTTDLASRKAFSCGGALVASGSEMAVRRPEGWKPLPASRCMQDLLVTMDDSRVSVDQGETWIPLPKGRPRTTTQFDGQDWWSVGWSSLTLWPR